MLKTFCLASRRMVALFSLERISSGARRRLKPRALERPQVGFESSVKRCSSTSVVFASRRIRPFAIQKTTRIAFSESFSVSSKSVANFHRLPVARRVSSGCMNLLTIKASCRKMLNFIAGLFSVRASRMSSASKLCLPVSVSVYANGILSALAEPNSVA